MADIYIHKYSVQIYSNDMLEMNITNLVTAHATDFSMKWWWLDYGFFYGCMYVDAPETMRQKRMNLTQLVLVDLCAHFLFVCEFQPINQSASSASFFFLILSAGFKAVPQHAHDSRLTVHVIYNTRIRLVSMRVASYSYSMNIG